MLQTSRLTLTRQAQWTCPRACVLVGSATGGAGGRVPPILYVFNIMPMGAAWKESTSNDLPPPTIGSWRSPCASYCLMPPAWSVRLRYEVSTNIFVNAECNRPITGHRLLRILTYQLHAFRYAYVFWKWHCNLHLSHVITQWPHPRLSWLLEFRIPSASLLSERLKTKRLRNPSEISKYK